MKTNIFVCIFFLFLNVSNSFVYSTFLCVTNHTTYPLAYRMLNINENKVVKHKQEISVQLNVGYTQTHTLPDDGKDWHVTIYGDPYESMPLSGSRLHYFLLPASASMNCAIRDRQDRRELQILLTSHYLAMTNMISNSKKS